MTDLHAAAGEYLAIRRALGFKLRGHDAARRVHRLPHRHRLAYRHHHGGARLGHPLTPTCSPCVMRSG